jgi:hypothetical protein
LALKQPLPPAQGDTEEELWDEEIEGEELWEEFEHGW